MPVPEDTSTSPPLPTSFEPPETKMDPLLALADDDKPAPTYTLPLPADELSPERRTALPVDDGEAPELTLTPPLTPDVVRPALDMLTAPELCAPCPLVTSTLPPAPAVDSPP